MYITYHSKGDIYIADICTSAIHIYIRGGDMDWSLLAAQGSYIQLINTYSEYTHPSGCTTYIGHMHGDQQNVRTNTDVHPHGGGKYLL